MSTPTIAFFNNCGGVGTTSLVYHLAWMYEALDMRVLVADLDPQADLTAMFLHEDRQMQLWPEGEHPHTIYGCIRRIMEGVDETAAPPLETVELSPQGVDLLPPNQEFSALKLLPGDLLMSSLEDSFSEAWASRLDDPEHALLVMTAFRRILQKAADDHRADVILADLGPNLGAINRAALFAADHVIIPFTLDVHSLQGARGLGPTLRRWKNQWREWRKPGADKEFADPIGAMRPLGYILLKPLERIDQPTWLFKQCRDRIPGVYETYVLGEPANRGLSVGDDDNCIYILKNYGLLTPIAQEARKPVFHLKSADMVAGAYYDGARAAYRDYEHLARAIGERAALPLATP